MPARGFTLVEMAIVLVIVGLVILMVFPALTAMRGASQRATTQSNLQALMRAAAAFTQATGCLPCPTPANATATGFGYVRGDNTAPTKPCNGCATAEGIVPYISLGIPSSLARDAWGHWISMRVDPVLTQNFAVVPPTSACTAADLPPNTVTPTCQTVNASQKGMCQSGLNKNNSVLVQTLGAPSTQNAAILFISYGAHGYGSFIDYLVPVGYPNGNRIAFPSSTPACSGTQGFARCNADGDQNFIDALTSNDEIDGYDDLMIYADRNSFVSLFGNGSCNTAW